MEYYLPQGLYTTYLIAGLVLLLTLIFFASSMGSSNSRFAPQNKHCYIGGGSEGLGLALACQLAARGAHVSIVSRTESKLAKALLEIETHRVSPSQKLLSFACDLTSAESASATLKAACEAHSTLSPDYIFACAGGCIPGYFTELSVDEQWKAMEWNFKSCLGTIHEGIKGMEYEGRQGKVVLTASLMALMGFAGYSAYAPSKFAIRGLADSLRNELLLYGISVHLFLPATIYSPGFDREQQLKPELCKAIEGPDEGFTPEKVAQALIKGLERNEFYITYEPVGNMIRNSRGIVPRNSFFFDTLWGVAGTIGLPLWRIFFADKAVKVEAKKRAKEAVSRVVE